MATLWREHNPVAWSPLFGFTWRWAPLGGAGGGVPGAWPLAAAARACWHGLLEQRLHVGLEIGRAHV